MEPAAIQSSVLNFNIRDSHTAHKSGNLNSFNPSILEGTSSSAPHGTKEGYSDHQGPMVFQQHQQQQQQQYQHQHQRNQLQQQNQQQHQQQQQHGHSCQHQQHTEMQQQQQQQQQRLLQQQHQHQSQMSSLSRNDFISPGSNPVKGYSIDPNLFHQHQQEQQHLQQQAQLQNFQFQRAVLPNDHPLPHPGVVGSSVANFGSMPGALRQLQRQRQQHLLASAASCNPSIWDAPPPGAASRHSHLSLELAPRNDDRTTGRKRGIASVQGDITNPFNSNWNTSKVNPKQAQRSEKKREQEKQRRSDLNEKFATLIHVVKRIENEEEDVERKRTLHEEAMRKRKVEQEGKELKEQQVQAKISNGVKEEGNQEAEKSENGSGDNDSTISSAENARKKQKVENKVIDSWSSVAEMISTERRDFKRRFPCFISPSNRSDLVARAVSHLLKYTKIRNKLNGDLDAMMEKVKEVRRGNTESKKKLSEMNFAGAMLTPSTSNPMIMTVGDNSEDTDSAEKPLAKDDIDKASAPSSTIVIKDDDELQQLQQQQQPQQMMMMMPIFMNPDGSFNQPIPNQFMSLPMASIGAHIFNNMMMMPSPMTEQQGQQQDQGGAQNEQAQDEQPQEDPASGDGKREATVLSPLVNSLTEQQGQHHAQGGTYEQQKQEVKSREGPAGGDEKLEVSILNSLEASSSPSASDGYRSRFSSSPHSVVPSNISKVDVEGGDESKSKLPDDGSTSKCHKEKSDDDELSEEAQSSSADVVNDKPTKLEEPQYTPMSNDAVRTGDNETLTASCSNGVDTTKDSHNESISKILNPETTLAKVAHPNSPMSPATNLSDSEQKLFPSPATPQPETVPKGNDPGTIDVTLA